MVSNNFSFVVGDGKRTRFWKDSWCGDTSPIEAYPSLFTIACAKNAWLGDVWSAEMGGGVVGILLYSDLLTIGRWMTWRVCCVGGGGGGGGGGVGFD